MQEGSVDGAPDREGGGGLEGKGKSQLRLGEGFSDISNLFLHYSTNPFHIPLKSCMQLAIKAVKYLC